VRYDALVVGAGPAGSIAARRLAMAGARVALVGGASRAGFEGLSARSIALIADEGVGPEIRRGDSPIAGPVARRGRWAGGRTVLGTEWLVERRALAAALRATAQGAGVEDRYDLATHLGRHARGWRVHLRSGGVLEAGHLIDARGRRGHEQRGPLLLAVGRQFRVDSRTPRALIEGTHIEAVEGGWCWWAIRGAMLWVQVIGRPRHGTEAFRHPANWLRAAAADIPALAKLLDEAAPDGAPIARPAHARLGVGGTGELTHWHVGDAALALDPLSGQGVYEAVRGARLVATAVHSVLAGGDAALAQRFVRARQHEAWITGVRLAAGFYRENSERSGFWAETARAYERLMPTAPPIAPSIERRPVLAEGRILEREVVVTAQHPRGVWHVAGVPLASLKGYIDWAPHSTLADAAAVLDHPLKAVAAALHWLQETGMVARPAGRRMSSGD
jgi:2-polyprenyl-6-methoxyphenol hydroxylase-like FAD-dependent oxidoreductase